MKGLFLEMRDAFCRGENRKKQRTEFKGKEERKS